MLDNRKPPNEKHADRWRLLTLGSAVLVLVSLMLQALILVRLDSGWAELMLLLLPLGLLVPAIVLSLRA